MKVNLVEVQKKIKELVRQKLVQEGVLTDDLIPGAGGKLAAYLDKTEKFIDKTIEEASALADEGEELLRSDFATKDSMSMNVNERNRILLTIVGFLRKVRNGLALTTVEIRKAIG